MATQNDGANAVERFKYPLSGVATHDGWLGLLSAPAGSRVPVLPTAASPKDCQTNESEAACRQARAEGIEEGRRVERLERSAQLQLAEEQRNEQVSRCCEQYEVERDRLLRLIEPEVVKLALSVAERIVRREVEIDPLILTSAVRVALSQLAEKSTVRIHVPAVDAVLWSETVAHLPNLRTHPEIVADEHLRPGECELECDCGVADLSVANQLDSMARNLLGKEEAASEFRPRPERSTTERNR